MGARGESGLLARGLACSQEVLLDAYFQGVLPDACWQGVLLTAGRLAGRLLPAALGIGRNAARGMFCLWAFLGEFLESVGSGQRHWAV